jgi:hypothetical protein
LLLLLLIIILFSVEYIQALETDYVY